VRDLLFAPPVVHEVLGTAGHPLEQVMRGQMEARFGHDFSRVRRPCGCAGGGVGAGGRALRQYTVGHDVVFRQGVCAGTEEGRR
jgi:hypothetical protein